MMIVHVPVLTLHPTAYEPVTVTLPALGLSECDGGKAVTAIMDLVRQEGPVLQKLLTKVLEAEAVGSPNFDASLLSVEQEAKHTFCKHTSTHRYARAWFEALTSMLTLHPKGREQCYMPSQGRVARDYAHKLQLAISALSQSTYLLPEFLYQNKGNWTLMPKRMPKHPERLTIHCPAITSL